MSPLEEREVQDFLLAAKTVKRPATMRWIRITMDHLSATFHVEVDSVAVGQLTIVHTSALPRHYNINLDFQGETVCMWHVRDFGKHRNKTGTRIVQTASQVGCGIDRTSMCGSQAVVWTA